MGGHVGGRRCDISGSKVQYPEWLWLSRQKHWTNQRNLCLWVNGLICLEVSRAHGSIPTCDKQPWQDFKVKQRTDVQPVGVAACFWLVSHSEKIDCQGLSKDVHLPSLYQQLSSLQQEALQLPALQRGALRECAGGWGWFETCRTKVVTSLGYLLSLVLTMFNYHHMAIRGCILGGINMEQQLLWEWSKRRNRRYRTGL